MHVRFRRAFLLLVFLLPAVTAAKDGFKGGKKAAEATEADYQALALMKKAVGKITEIGGSDRGFTFRYEYTYLQPNQGKINAANKALARRQQQQVRRYNQILRMRDPVKKAAAMDRFIQRIQREQLNSAKGLFKLVTIRKNFDLEATSDVKVRFRSPPVEYDDKGHLKEYTAKELKALKGKDPKLPGYQGTWDQLTEGQTVKLYFKARPKKKDKKAKDQDPLESLGEDRPLVRMILVLKEATSDDVKPKKNKKGK
jgi:hypothetical protein